MTNEFAWYTHIAEISDGLGIRVRHPETKVASYYKSNFTPTSYTPCLPEYATGKNAGTWHTLDGRPLYEKVHPNIKDYRQYVHSQQKLGRPVYGDISPVYQFMAQHVPVSCGIPFPALRTVYLDIETGTGAHEEFGESIVGFSEPEDAKQPVTLITAWVDGHTYTWGCGAYENAHPTRTYIRCADERELFMRFVEWWQSDYPDILTGWNVQGYDVTYLINRMSRLRDRKVLPTKYRPEVLSPWRKLSQRRITIRGRDSVARSIVGVEILDYLELYARFSANERESYTLAYITQLELGETKISYDDYGSLEELYHKNYSLYVDYNIKDVELVVQLNQKLMFLDLATRLAYAARVNFVDIHRQVRLWDAMIYYVLYDRNIAVPPHTDVSTDEDLIGGYVKVPRPGHHRWVVSFDVNSLYPTLMREWNISPDAHLTLEWLTERLADITALPESQAPIDPATIPETPIQWIDTVSVADAPVARWALSSLIAYITAPAAGGFHERVLADLTVPTYAWKYLKILSVCMAANGQVYRTDKDGFLTEMLTRLYAERKHAKSQETACERLMTQATTDDDRRKYEQQMREWGIQQNTRKTNLNSAYGALGNKHHRFYDIRDASAVTATGQVVIRFVADKVNAYLNELLGTTEDYILASDTDSIYVTLAPLVKNISSQQIVSYIDAFCANELQSVIDGAFQEIHQRLNTRESVLAMKREVIAEHGVWKAKKRYILWVHDKEGVRYETPKLKIVGIEAVRSSTSSYARGVIKQGIIHFVRGEQSEFYAFMDRIEREFHSLPFRDIASPRSVNGMVTYDPGDMSAEFVKKTPVQVKASIIYNRYLEQTGLTHKYPTIHDAQKIRFCYLVPNNPLRASVIASPLNTLPEEWGLDAYLDRALQFEKTIRTPLEKIVSLGGWTIEATDTLW